MNAVINFNATDYMAIARIIRESHGNENGTYQVEYVDGKYTLCLDVYYSFDLDISKGDRYTPPYEEIAEEYFDISNAKCHNLDGEELEHNFSTKEQYTILG